jgi:very-short-patch-repair endonuclease
MANRRTPDDLLNFARAMRHEHTKAEALLWRLLRGRRFMAFKVRRQHVIGDHIVDLYCHEARIAIELDGGGHAEDDQTARDSGRDTDMQTRGIRVLRFWNTEVLQNTEGVLEAIHDALLERCPGGPRGEQ